MVGEVAQPGGEASGFGRIRYGHSVSTSELMAAEDAGWGELHALMDSLSPEDAERPGYYPEGWSAKDVLAHVGSCDVDAMNDQFLEALKDVPLQTVRAQAWSARTRMLQAWGALGDLPDEARFWIRKAGAEHYDEHLPRLREWVEELRSG